MLGAGMEMAGPPVDEERRDEGAAKVWLLCRELC